MKKSKKEIYEIFEKIEQESGIYRIKVGNFSLYEKIRVDIQNQFISDEVYIKSGFFFKEEELNERWEVPEKIDVLTVGFKKFSQEQLFTNFQEELKDKVVYSLLLESGPEPNISLFKKNYISSDRLKFTEDEEKIIENFEKKVVEKFREKSGIRNSMNKAKKEFLSEKESIELFLEKYKVKKIILLKGYRNKPLMYVAKNKSIPIIEVQYANISDYHGGFSTWYKDSILPNELQVWTSIYKERLMNYKGDIIVSLPESLKEKVKSKKKQILVIAQSYYIKEFEELAEKLADENLEKKIILVLKKNVLVTKNLKKLIKKRNIECLFKERRDVIDLIGKSKWVVSGYSTVLIEANFLGSIPLISKEIPNSSEFNDMIERKQMIELTNYKVDEYNKVNRIKG